MTSPLASSTRWLDATAQAELVASGEVTATDLVEAAIERIEAFDAPLNSVVIRWYDDRELPRPMSTADSRAASRCPSSPEFPRCSRICGRTRSDIR